jgi:glutathione S-transferase
MKFLEDPSLEHPPFAPPFLKAGKLLISQTANILQFLAPRLGLVPKSEASRLWVHQLQLTIADWLYETGQTHHPIANALYYESRAPRAKARRAFRFDPNPNFSVTEILKVNVKSVTSSSASGWLTSISHSSSGRGFALSFPKTMATRTATSTGDNYDRIKMRFTSRLFEPPRRLAFNQQGTPPTQDGRRID